MLQIAFAYGCVATVSSGLTSHGVPSHFVKNHHRWGNSNTWSIKPEVKKRASNTMASSLKENITDCEMVDIGGCNDRLAVAHLDGGQFNNALGNLKKLCRSHHRLVDHGRIDIDNQVMLEFVVSNGKRRYRKSSEDYCG